MHDLFRALWAELQKSRRRRDGLVCLLAVALIPAAGRVLGFAQKLDGAQLVWLLLCTGAVNCLLFFAASVLLVLSHGPMLTLCAGMAASLTGIFTAYMPQSVSYLVPWGYFMPLSSIRMEWDRQTRISTYFSRGFDLPLLAWTLLLAVGLAAACWQIVREKEV